MFALLRDDYVPKQSRILFLFFANHRLASAARPNLHQQTQSILKSHSTLPTRG